MTIICCWLALNAAIVAVRLYVTRGKPELQGDRVQA